MPATEEINIRDPFVLPDNGSPVSATREANMSPVSSPSPVVAQSDMITCPDCSPPKLKLS